MDNKTRLESHIAEEMEKYGDVCFPVRSSLIRRLLVRECACTRLHPNPGDEFSMPSVGPSDQIISRYMESFRRAKARGREYCEEPVLVERMYPDGYMIVNGHHRWAAALKLGYKRIPVSIVNLTQESEIKKWLDHSKNKKRVALDLDEVVLVPEHGEAAEKPLPFPLSRVYREALRRGIPALFDFLAANGYDIWVYSDNCCSYEHIRALFALHHARVTGVITGFARKTRLGNNLKAKINAMMAAKYQVTVHIDGTTLIRTDRSSKGYDEFSLKSASGWAQEVMRIVREFDKNEDS